MFVGDIEKRLKIAREIFINPEQFLINKYYNVKPPEGFRIELLTARKYNLICDKLKQFKLAHFRTTDIRIESGRFMSMIAVKKIREAVSGISFAKHTKKTFCPYCEKAVIPNRLHKLDTADIVLLLFTAGLWGIFLLVMYIFIRRCPVCNYNLRGFKSLTKDKRQ
jgi:hypothetical protein